MTPDEMEVKEALYCGMVKLLKQQKRKKECITCICNRIQKDQETSIKKQDKLRV